jgi:hypothetical protein
MLISLATDLCSTLNMSMVCVHAKAYVMVCALDLC